MGVLQDVRTAIEEAKRSLDKQVASPVLRMLVSAFQLTALDTSALSLAARHSEPWHLLPACRSKALPLQLHVGQAQACCVSLQSPWPWCSASLPCPCWAWERCCSSWR